MQAQGGLMEDDGKARDWPGLTRRLGLRSNILAWRDYWIEESCFALGREAKALWVEHNRWSTRSCGTTPPNEPRRM